MLSTLQRGLLIIAACILLLMIIIFSQENSKGKEIKPPCSEILYEANKEQLSNLKVYFNNAQYKESNNINLILECYIKSSKRHIDAHFYQANDPIIRDAFIDAKNRGVIIRFITDDHYYNHNKYYTSFYSHLENAGIPVFHDQKDPHTNGQSHNKFAIIDNEYVWTGSYNITTNGASLNANNALYIHSQDLASEYEKEFNEMWGSKNESYDISMSRFGNQKLKNTKREVFVEGVGKVEICFDPSDGCKQMTLDTLESTDYSIDLAMFSFTDDDIGNAIVQLVKENNIEIQGVFHAEDKANGEYNKLNEISPDTILLRKELPFIPRLIHHKFFIIDAETDSNPIVITGSRNPSKSSEMKNDENTIIIRNADVAQRFRAELWGLMHENALP